MCLEDEQIATEIDKFPDKILAIMIKLKQTGKGLVSTPLYVRGLRKQIKGVNKGITYKI